MVRERIYIYDRSGNQILNAAGALSKARGLSFQTQVPGGYGPCSFEVPLHFLRGWDVGLAHTLRVYDGLTDVYTGRIEDLTKYVDLPGRMVNGWRRITAIGFHQNLAQRLATLSYPSGTTTASTVLFDVLGSVIPMVSADANDIQDPGVNLVPISWTNQYATQILDDLLKYGDTETPPRSWLWAVWGYMQREATLIYSDWSGGAAGNQPADVNWDGSIQPGTSGTITMSGAQLRCNTVARGETAMIVSAAPLPTERRWHIEHKCLADLGTEWIDMLGLCQSAAQPTWNNERDWPQIFVRQHNSSIRIAYQDSGGAWRWWEGASNSWKTVEATGIGTTWPYGWDNRSYIIVFHSDSSGWWIEVLYGADGSSLTKTTAVSWTDTINDGNPWWVLWGDFSNVWGYGYIDSYYIRITQTSNKPVAKFWPRDLSDYDIQIPLRSIRGQVAISDTLSKTRNNVLASYGASSVTAAASDAASIDRYDQRDYLVSAGNVSLAVAQKARDTDLERHSGPTHPLSPLTIVGDVRNKPGARYPLNQVKAGLRFIVPELGDTVYMISHTRYDADQGAMSINIDEAPETVDMLLAQALRR